MYFLQKINQKSLLLGLFLACKIHCFCYEDPTGFTAIPKESPENRSDYEQNDDDSAHDDSDNPNPNNNPSNLPIYPNCEMGYFYEDGHCIPLNKDPYQERP